jgi:hypothetical protein
MTTIKNSKDAYAFILAHHGRVIESVKGDTYASTMYRLDDGSLWNEYASLYDPADYSLTKIGGADVHAHRNDPVYFGLIAAVIVLVLIVAALIHLYAGA